MSRPRNARRDRLPAKTSGGDNGDGGVTELEVLKARMTNAEAAIKVLWSADTTSLPLNAIGTLNSLSAARFERIDGKLEAVLSRLGGVEEELTTVGSRLHNVGHRLSGVEDRLGSVEGKIDVLTAMLGELVKKG